MVNLCNIPPFQGDGLSKNYPENAGYGNKNKFLLKKITLDNILSIYYTIFLDGIVIYNF